MPQQLFSALAQAASTTEGKALYLLALLCLTMALDFLLGSLAAWRDPSVKFTSGRGIDGILRKLASILVLTLCIPRAPEPSPSSCSTSAISSWSSPASSRISNA